MITGNDRATRTHKIICLAAIKATFWTEEFGKKYLRANNIFGKYEKKFNNYVDAFQEFVDAELKDKYGLSEVLAAYEKIETLA